MKKILMFLIAANLSCSTFKSKIDLEEPIKCSEKTLSLYIGYNETTNLNNKKGGGGLEEMQFSKEVISKRIQFYDIKNKLEKSCLFKKVEFDSRNSDYIMEIFIDYRAEINWLSYTGALFTIFITGGYWIIPYNAYYGMKVSVKLSENKTKTAWKQNQEEEIKTWFHPFLIFTAPFYTLNRAQDIVTDNIVNSIVKDLSGREFLYK